MKKALIISFLGIFLASSAFAQNKRERKMQGAIDALMGTEFVKKYNDYKLTIETTALDFKTQSDYYEESDVSRIRFGYEN